MLSYVPDPQTQLFSWIANQYVTLTSNSKLVNLPRTCYSFRHPCLSPLFPSSLRDKLLESHWIPFFRSHSSQRWTLQSPDFLLSVKAHYLSPRSFSNHHPLLLYKDYANLFVFIPTPNFICVHLCYMYIVHANESRCACVCYMYVVHALYICSATSQLLFKDLKHQIELVVCTWVCTCYGLYEEVRGQLSGVDSLLPLQVAGLKLTPSGFYPLSYFTAINQEQAAKPDSPGSWNLASFSFFQTPLCVCFLSVLSHFELFRSKK